MRETKRESEREKEEGLCKRNRGESSLRERKRNTHEGDSEALSADQSCKDTHAYTYRHIQTGRHTPFTDRQTDIHTDSQRETERQRDRQAGIQMTHRHDKYNRP